ncbi:Hypothetical predicted protein [Olea europaea subsp. europaea]|uniref:Uncharacterized protein n=1 Tax=Olea europaea subsp. europaea TaxID=158383 RepID=A0A8S0UU19_OLEEU|nr:Hypothetical predicted protein [Olea europaea subsp. europaea]
MVRRKVETQFEEEDIGKEKKTIPPTPAPLGTINRRKGLIVQVFLSQRMHLIYGVESRSEADDTVDDGLEYNDDKISCDTKSQNATEKETENAEDMDFEVSQTS